MRRMPFVVALALAACLGCDPAAAQPRAHGQCLQLVRLYRPEVLEDSPGKPASRCATTPSIPTTCWRRSCWPANPATTWWCRPLISSSARSRPACSRSSTRASFRTSPILARDRAAARDLRSRQPVRRQLHVGHDRHRLQRQEGARDAGRRGKIDSWDIVFKPENLAKFKDCGVHMLDSADDMLPAALAISASIRTPRSEADMEKAADLLIKMRPVGAEVSFLRISQRAGERRNLLRGRLFRRHQAGAEARRRSEERRRDRLCDPEGRRAVVVRQSRDPEGCQECRRGARIHQLPAAAGVAAKNSNFVSYANGNLASQKFIDQAILEDQTIYPDDATMARLYTIIRAHDCSRRSAADEPAVDADQDRQ